MDEGGDKHPAQGTEGERVLIGVDAVAAEELNLYVHPCQLHHSIPKVELGEDQESVAQLLEDFLDGLQDGKDRRKEIRGRERGEDIKPESSS